MHCTKCGAENGPRELYCRQCGNPLPTEFLSESQQLIVHKNTNYYGKCFSALRRGKKISWNWAAFLGFGLWAAYRKMWALSLLWLVALQGLFFFQVLWLAPVLMLLGGLFGNTLYYRKVRCTVRDIAAQPQKARQAQLARRGGVSVGAAVLVGVLLLLLCWWWAFFFSGMPALVAVRG